MQGRIGLMEAVGSGDRVQVENTAKELRKLGAQVEISTHIQADEKIWNTINVKKT